MARARELRGGPPDRLQGRFARNCGTLGCTACFGLKLCVMSQPESPLALARDIHSEVAEELCRDLGAGPGRDLGVLLGTAFPPLRPALSWQLKALERLERDGWRTHPRRETLVRRLMRAAGEMTDQEAVMAALRRATWAEKARIALREVLPPTLGGADVTVTAQELSDLAEAALEVALAEAMAHAARRFGDPIRADGKSSTLVVFGLGKLGGSELNAGSDVDIVAFYDTDEGGSSVTLHEHWTHVMRRAVATIETPTGDGFVWRVDLRLRPEGSRGPLVYSWTAAERYYETWGRLWERAALLRARPIAGDHDLGAAFAAEVVGPFVFRRKVDPSIATALAELVQRSRKELSADVERDLKLGPGGIREAEFFVQALQLIWGGRHQALRVQGSLVALERLRGQGLVSDREAKVITDAYLLLRRAEHAVQWRTGLQTHLLPKPGAERDALARVLGFGSEVDLQAALSSARSGVTELFASILPESPRPPPRYTLLLAELAEAGDALRRLVEQVFGEGEVAEHLLALARRPDSLLGVMTRERYPELADRVIDALVNCSDPEHAARYLRSFFSRFASPSPYFEPLASEPRVLSRLITVLASSAFVGDALIGRPDLADSVLFSERPISAAEARAAVVREVESFRHQLGDKSDPEETREEFIGALRRAKGKVMVEVAVADLAEELDIREVTYVLSELADETLEQAVRFEMGDKKGLAVIAVGKLGGREIGYGSDLDVLFIYDPAAAPEREDPAEFFTRRAQRIIRLVTLQHWAGPGYELDTRLRPSGSQGLLVTSLESFARYHRVQLHGAERPSNRPVVLSSGAAWERQALLRARACAGDVELGKKVIEVAQIAAYERGAPSAAEVDYLRTRMERELARERPGRYDLKMGRGGLFDIEFVVQWLQMRFGADPRVRTSDTLDALGALQSGDYVSRKAFDVLRDGYLFLRRLEQRIRIVHGSGSPVIDASGPGLDKLARRVGIRRSPHESEGPLLLEAYRDVTERVRATYLELMGVN